MTPETWTQTIERYLAEGRTVSGGKGDSTAQAAEQNQLAFTEELQSIFQSQFQKQSATLAAIQKSVLPQLTNPTGYSPAALAALRASSVDNIATQFQHAQVALQEHEAQTGGNDLPSGVNAQLDVGLYAKEAEAQAAAGNDVTLANENLKQQNYWRALNVLSGNANEMAPTQYGSEANQGSGEITGLSEANTQANNSGFLHTLGNSFAETVGHTLGGGNAPGGGGGVSGFFGE